MCNIIYQSSRDKSHAVSVIAESWHLCPMSVERNCAVAAGNVKYTHNAVAVTNRKLRRVMTTSQWRYTLLISSKHSHLQYK